MRYFSLVLLICITNIGLSQVSSFPLSESFETAFTTGTNVSFMSNWTGNKVASSNRIYQGADPRTGSSSLNIIPISSFSGEILISLDLTGLSNSRVQFYAYSKKNGSASSTRPAILSFSTSINGGIDYIDDTSIGNDSTFPNDNSTSYSLYTYDIDATAANQANVILKITVERGSGAGSTAELVIDDLRIEDQVSPLEITSTTSLSSTSVLVAFNQAVSQATAETISNYAINNGVSVINSSRNSSNEVTLTTTVMPNNNYQVTINGVEDLASNTPASNLQENFTFISPLIINSTNILNKNTIVLFFNLDLDVTSAEVAANYNIDNGIGTPNAVELDVVDNKKVTLTLATDLTDNTYETTVNTVTDLSTFTTAVNLKGSAIYLPLEITDLTSLTNTQVQVTFNQNVESIQANTSSNYVLGFGYESPTSAVQNVGNAAIVILNYATSFVNNTYELTINNLHNTSGNANTNNLQSSFTNNTATGNRQILINEIFADPTGSSPPIPLVLPSGTSDEYIELYNASSDAIDIGGFDMGGGTVGTFVLQPDSYVILTSASKVTTFQHFGDVVAVASWNTLTNGGEQLILRDNLGNLIDSLTYNLNWFNDEAKSDGAWSIEQLNPALICSDSKNWSASTSFTGGTPGIQNAIYNTSADITSPNLLSVTHHSSQELTVMFDEIMDQGSLISGNYTLDNGLAVTNVSIINVYAVNLTIDEPMTSGTIYELTINGVTDCPGNAIDSNALTYLYDVEAPVFQRFVFRDTVTIEVIFDEEVEETSVELASNFLINKGIGLPNSSTLDPTDSTGIILVFDKPMALNSVYSLSHQNLKDTLGNSSSLINSAFTFRNDIDTVIVVSSQLLDVYFDQDVNQTTAESRLNYAVEKAIGAPVTASLDIENQKLVHLIFDDAFTENTDQVVLFDEIEALDKSLLQLLNTKFVYDTDDPDIDSVVVIDGEHLQVYFDEKLDPTSAEAVNNYSVNNSVGNPDSISLQPDATSVILTFSLSFEQELEHSVTITGVEDPLGNAISNNRNYDFIHDQLAPRLVGITVLNPTTILVAFSEVVEQLLAENTANYSVDNGIGFPITAKRSSKNLNEVLLTFVSLGNNALNRLTISNITDLFSNELPLALSATFVTNTSFFGSLTILCDTTLQFQFNKYLTKASAESISNYGFDNGVGLGAIAQDEGDASILKMNLNKALLEGVDYRITANNLIDTDGNTSFTISYDFQYDPLIRSISILSPNSVLIIFDKDVDETTAETTSNYSIDSGIGNPLTAVRNNKSNNELTLLFSNSLIENADYVLKIQNLLDVFSGQISGSNNSIIYDTSAPIIAAINSTFSNEIEVVFNEIIDQSTAQTLIHYALDNGIGTPTSAVRSTLNLNTVILQFASDLISGTDYQITVDRVEDSQGKAIESATFNFNFEAILTPNFREIVINEVYFDTELDAGIPNIEYVELYNRSAKSFELRGLSFGDLRDTATFTSFTFSPNSYLIVTSMAGANDFEEYGEVLGIPNFPSLSNSGETIKIFDRGNSIIDSLSFDDGYYNDTTKEDGGFSVELINPNRPCFDLTNYAASINVNGGTPGEINAVFDNSPDTLDPTIDVLKAASTVELQLTFNESMDISTLVPENFILEDGVTVSSVDILDDFGRNITLHLNTAFQKGLSRNLTLNSVADCSGNMLSNFSYDFLIGAAPSFHDLLVTEIMATPSPNNGLPEHEYIELYNASTSIIALEGIILSDENGSVVLTAHDLHPDAYLIVTGNNDLNDFSIYGDILGTNNFPTLAITDRVKLETSSQKLIFEVNYDKTFYHDETKDDGGYSMEMINLEAVCFDDTNWTAASNITGGTPGVQNSVYDIAADSQAPEISNVKVITDQQIKVTFNESMDVSTIVKKHFFLSDGLIISELEILDQFGLEVLINLSAPFNHGIAYFLNLIGLSDCSGNSLPTTYESFYLGAAPSFHDLLVTEIMATPSPNNGLPEHEYIELYNASTSIITLEGIILSDENGSVTLTAHDLHPDAYLIVTGNKALNDLSIYGDILGTNNFPTLAITDRVKIETSTQELIFEVNYNKTFYHDETKDDGGYSMEMINLEAVCFDDKNWTAASNITGGTPGVQNSVYDIAADSQAPEISNVKVITDQQIKVTFNESMDVSTIVKKHFFLSDGLIISELEILDQFGLEVLINLSAPFNRGIAYFLNLIGLSDCSGNSLPTNNESFYLGARPSFHELIITEIMARPNPTQGMPKVEYLEIYNTSNKIISLGGISLSDLSGATTLPEKSIDPGSYITLVPFSVDPLMNTYGEILAIPGWRTLNSAADNLTMSLDNNLIFEVFYTDEWYRSSQKSNGGYSLEMIDQNYPCYEKLNWKASENINGGTPGVVNSVADSNPDLVGPSISEAIATSENHIQLTFDEKLCTDNIGLSNFNISPGLSISTITVETAKRSVILTTDLLRENTVYDINVDNLSDCSGNLIQTNGRDVSLIIPAIADSLDIVINEVLFNPNTGGAKFVEIYNNSTNYINLKNWSLAGHNNQRLITIENIIIYPMSFKVLTKDQTTLKDNYPEAEESTFIIMNSMPNISSTEGSITLIDNLDQIIDHMNYSEDYHSVLLNDLNGVSLERIRPNSSSIEPSNWYSASSIKNHATPGYANSQFQSGEEIQGNIAISPVTFSPNEPGQANFTTLNYTFDEPGNVLNVSIYDSQGNVVKEVTKNALVSTSGFFRWDGTTERGVKARIGYYMILFEIISPKGKVTIKKEKVAIGGHF